MTEHFILLKVSCSKEDPDLLDKIAGRAWTMDSVEDVTATVVDDEVVKDAERLDWLDNECSQDNGRRIACLKGALRAAIDAAMLKEGK